MSLIRLLAFRLIIYVSSGFFRDKGTSPSRFCYSFMTAALMRKRINQNDIILRMHQLAIIVIIANVCRLPILATVYSDRRIFGNYVSALPTGYIAHRWKCLFNIYSVRVSFERLRLSKYIFIRRICDRNLYRLQNRTSRGKWNVFPRNWSNHKYNVILNFRDYYILGLNIVARNRC